MEKFNTNQSTYPVSYAQKRMFLLDQLYDIQTSYNLPFMIRITGKIDIRKLEDAFRLLIKRHDILHTSFEAIQGDILQRCSEEIPFDLVHIQAKEDQMEGIIREFIRPFNLGQAPLFRAELVELSETEFRLLVDIHHIIADGVSIGIFNEELIALYTGKELPKPGLQYRDYIAWEDEYTQTSDFHEQENYWLAKFVEIPSPVELPLDYARTNRQTFNGQMLKRVIEPEMVSGLNQLAFKNRITLNVVMLAVYSILLSKYTSQDDFIIGAAVNGRQLPGVKSSIGLFVNTLPLRIKINSQFSVSDLLKQLGQEVLEAVQNQDYPFDRLIEQLNISSDRSRNPLIDTMLIFHNQAEHRQAIEIEQFKFSVTRIQMNAAVVDLVLDIYLVNDGSVECYWQFNADLFCPETIARMANQFEHILRVIQVAPDQKLLGLEIITPEEKQLILNGFNDTQADYPKNKTIIQLFEEQVRKTPENTAAIFGETQLSYRGLNEKANQLARALRNKGIQADEIVGIMVERSLEMLIGIFAILKAGGAYLPIDPEYPAERIDYFLNDSAVKLLLTKGQIRNDLHFDGTIIDLADERLYCGENHDFDKLNTAKNLAYVIYTSGSTGKPKGTMIEHYSVVNRLNWMQKSYKLTGDDAILQKTTFTFDVSVWELFWWALNGAKVCLLKPGDEKDPGQIVSAIQKNRITTIHFVPSMLNAFLDHLEGNEEIVERLSSLRQVFASGEALTLQQVERFNHILNNRNRTKLFNLYGPTEATVDVSYFDCSTGEKLNWVPIGKPIDNIKLYIIDQYQRLQPIGVPGELCIAGDGLARGYLKRPELTNEKFVPNPFNNSQSSNYQLMYKTGDIARWLPDGNIEYLGRADHQVKIRGFRIELGEIENQLLQHELIREAVVVVKEDQNHHKYLCAYLATEQQISIPEIRSSLSQMLPEYMIPSYFIQLSKLPLTPNGKIDRKALPEPEGLIQTGVEYVAPQNEVEEKLVSIWQGVLGLEKIGMLDNFFELGGHSLKATILVARVFKEFNIEIALREVFETPTIKGLAEYIRRTEKNPYASIRQVEKDEYYPVSSAQRRLFIIDRMEGAGTSYNLPNVMVLEGKLDRERFEAAFQGLVDRHETLRTSFEMNEGEPVQRIHEGVRLIINYQESEETEIDKLIQGFIRPFCLSEAPLLRVGLLKITDTKHILLYDMHHIISDGVSIGVLNQEFISLYQGLPLPELRIQYKDYAVWQNELFSTEIMAKQEEYWVNTFNGEIPVLNLTTDFVRPVVQSFEGDRISFFLESEHAAKLNQLAQENGSSLYMVLLAVYNVLLSKYTGQTDIIIGSPIAGRQHADLEKIIGMFVNTLTMRNYPQGEKSFREFLKEVRENALAAYENQDYQFEQLVEKLNLRRDLSRNPLFDTMFILQNLDYKKVVISGLEITPYQFKNKIAKFDLNLQAVEVETGIYFELEYCTKLFKSATVTRIARHFIHLITEIIKNPELQLSAIEMITAEEKEQILHVFNHTRSEYPAEITIHELFEEQVKRTPEQVALICENRQLTYGELNRKANQLAEVLRMKGIKRDKIVGLVVERSLEMVIGILGILKSGGAYLPIDPEYPEERIGFMLKDSGAQVILIDNRQSIIHNEDSFITINLHDEGIYQGNGSDLVQINIPNDLAYVIYTSGSTGKPKGVMVEHKGFINLLYCHRRLFQEHKTWNMSLISSPGFDAMAFELFPGLIFGNTLFVASIKDLADPQVMKKWLQNNQIEITFQPTPLAERMLELDYSSTEEFSLRKMLIAGDRLRKYPSSTTPFEVYNLYGPTEDTVWTTWSDLSASRDHETEFPTIGTPISNKEVYILDQLNHLQPVGIPGELCIGGVGLARGYLANRELTLEKFVTSPFIPGERIYRTGDLVRWLPDGKIEFLGRLDQQVKIRGFRIELGEIESQLLRYEAVKEVAVIAREDYNRTNYLCAYLVAERELAPMEIRGYLGKMLPEYMIPTYMIQLQKLPLNQSGKIDRKALPEPEGNIETGIEYQAPWDKIEETLVAIWQNVLGIVKIGIRDNFFILGGHSLKATIIISRIYQELNVEVPLREIFQTPTIDELAEYIRKAENTIHQAIEPVEKRDYYPASSAQKRLYILDKFEGVGTSYNIPMVLVITGELNRERLEATFESLIQRHEAFRTSFEMLDGELMQWIHSQVDFCMEYLETADVEMDGLLREFCQPFKLGESPLLRVKLIKLGPTKHWLCCDMHHIIADGTSMGILVKEIEGLYRGEELPELRIQYKDFAVWQNRLFEQGTIRGQEEYWLNKFRDSIPVLNLPTDFSRPAIQDFNGATSYFQLSPELASGLQEIALAAGATINMVLLAIFNILIYRYTGQQDIVIGHSIAGRHHADLESVIGMFVNMLAIRTYPSADKSFQEFLAEVKELTLEAYENQDYQFEVLVGKIELERSLTRNPLFDVAFVTQNMNIPSLNLTGLDFRSYQLPNCTSKFDLTLYAMETGYGIQLVFEYCTGLFKTETIQRMAEHFQNIVGNIIANPEVKIATVELISAVEKQKLLIDFNDTRADFPETTIHRLFEEQVDKVPQNIALVFGTEQLTYNELDHRANQVARYLLAQDIQPDMLVGLMLENSINQIIGIMGILKAGAGYLPIDPVLPEERIKHIINDAGVGVIISSKDFLRRLNRLQWDCPKFQRFLVLDSEEVLNEEETEKTELMGEKLWDYVAKRAVDEISGGAWISSYTGADLSQKEMDEYGDNALTKLRPFLTGESRVLEIGCASGITMYRIAPLVGFYYGTDLSGEMIAGNQERVKREGLTNIKLAKLAADQIDQIEETGFDLVIINSVIQCFHGHNYLRNVLTKAIALLKKEGRIFIGDVMDQDRKTDLIQSLQQFKQNNTEKNYRTKTDWSAELFVAKGYFEDLQADLGAIAVVHFSDKIRTIENELTLFRYDTILEINKCGTGQVRQGKRHKYQDGLKILAQFDETRVSVPVISNHTAYVIYTSGTTGQPKGVIIEHKNVVRLMFNNKIQFDFNQNDIWTMFHSYCFDFSVWEMYGALLYGGKLIIIPKITAQDSKEYLKVLKREKVTVLNQTPSAFYNLSDAEMQCSDDALHIRYIIFGGEALKPGKLKEWRRKYPRTKLINMYGITETTVHVTYKEITDEEIDLNISNIGRPIPTLTAYIMDPSMKLQPIGVAGELCVGGDGVGRGYLNRPELTAEKFVQNSFSIKERLYKSGDLARYLSNGEMEYLGRIDHQVKIRGFRIELGEIESKLLKHESIREAIAVAKEDYSGINYLCAYLVAERELSISEIREYLEEELPEYMIPSYFIQLEKMPLTPNGKIDRKILPEPEGNIQTGIEYIGPHDEIEETLVTIWQNVLGIGRIGIEDNFFVMGGHSLKATIVTSRINQELNVEVPLREIFQAPTIKELAEYIRETESRVHQAIEPAGQREYYPTSSAQKRLYILDKFEGIGTSYNIPLIFIISGELNRERLEATFKSLVRRHEAFRTSFEMVEGELVQRIHSQVVFSMDFQVATESEITGILQQFSRPFELGRAPLLRVKLIQLEPAKHMLCCEMHHIIADGTSLGILVQEINSLYRGEALPELRIQYKDFAVWQNKLFEQGTIRGQEDYWLNKFRDSTPVLNLPTDYSRPAMQDFHGDVVNMRLNGELTAGLKQIALASGATINMVLLSIFNILLHRYSGQEDIVIGHGIAGRHHADLEPVVGMFINMLAIRSFPAAMKSFREFLTEVKELTLEAFENQDYQFEVLVGKIDLDRNLARNPLFDIAFLTQNMSIPSLSVEGLDFQPYEFPNLISKFDLTLYAIESWDFIDLKFEYCTGLFKSETIQRMAEHYRNIARNIVANPEVMIAAVELLSTVEKEKLLVDFNNTQADFPVAAIHRLFEEQVDRTPENIALIFGGEQLTYKELDLRANQVTQYLLSQQIQPDMLVGVMLGNSINQIIAIMGILKAGAGYLPIDPVLPEERVKQIINDAGIEVIISGKNHLRRLNRLQWECPSFRRYLCLDSREVSDEGETEKSELMGEKLWDYVAKAANNEVSGGGWVSSYTGADLSQQEMDEYGENVLAKLQPYLNLKSKVLEIGCASGITMYRIAPLVGLYYGTDLSAEMIAKNQERIRREGLTNIKLAKLAADQIDQLGETAFDLVIINSVIQYFQGHNYLRKVIAKILNLVGEKGCIFIGDIMDQDRKQDLIQSLYQFKQSDIEKRYHTKTNFSTELFVSKRYFEDLQLDFGAIATVTFSAKIHTIENELTQFRYDAILEIDKNISVQTKLRERHKYQDGLNTLSQFSDARIAVPVTPQNIAYVIYTSGSTGIPKGVVIPHHAVVNFIQGVTKRIDFSVNKVILCITSLSFDIFVLETIVPLTKGLRIVIADDNQQHDPQQLGALITENRINMIQTTPSRLQLLVRDGLDFSEYDSLHEIMVGGEAFPDSLLDVLANLPQVRVYNMYGPTETTVWSTIKEITGNQVVNIGQPIDNTQIYILNNSDNLQPVGVPGELCIGGQGLARGYLSNPELTTAKFVANPFINRKLMYRTGDLAKWLPNGELEFLGRIDHQVKIRGYRIELGEIESLLQKHDQINEAVVLAGTDADGDKYLCAYFVAGNELTVAELREYLATLLPEYMIPSYFIQLEKFPLTPSGKVNRNALSEPDGNIHSGVKYLAPRNKTEEQLTVIWQNVLGVERIGIDDNFFALGGHSLKATSVVTGIYKGMNLEISLREIFQMPTIRELSDFVQKAKSNIYASIQPAEQKMFYPVSSAQKRLYIINKMEGAWTSYNMPGVMLLEGELDRGHLEKVFHELIERHDSLRTAFEVVAGEPVQRIYDQVEFEIHYLETVETKIDQIIREFIHPFDLAKAPLLRVELVKIGDEKQLLLFDMHHIISDAISNEILVREFVKLYRGESLPELRIQYKDYAVWQDQLFKTDIIQKQEEYWLQVFNGEIPVLNIITDYSRPAIQSFEGERLRFQLPSELAVGIKHLAQDNGATLYMVLLATFNILLAKYTGQEDVIIGSPIAGRPHPDLDNIIGMFVNTLAMRNYPEGRKTFREFLKEVLESALLAYENQDYPFEELVEKLNLRRDLSRNPLFDTMLVLLTPEYGKSEISKLKVSPYPFQNRIAKFDLTLQVVEYETAIDFELEYCTRLFKPETIQRIANHLVEIMKEIVNNPGLRLSEITMLSETEKQQLLYEFNDTACEYPKGKTIHQLFEEQAARYGENVALIDGEVKLTYQELNSKANQLARYLRSKGVKSDTIVAMIADRSPEMIIGILGILKAGGAYLPIDPEYPEDRIRFMLEDSQSEIVLTQTYNNYRLEQESIALNDNAIYTGATTNLEIINQPHDLAYIIYTSGTTGKPKGVMIEHNQVVRLMFNQRIKFDFDANDIWTMFHSYCFDFSVWEMYGALLYGGKLVIVSKYTAQDTEEFLRLLKRFEVTVLNQTPSAFYNLSDKELYCEDRELQIRYIIFGGEALKPEKLNDWYRKYPETKLINMYGITETTVHVTYKEITETEINSNISNIGQPIPTLTTYIMDPAMKLQPIGVAGELCVGGEGVGRGYLNRPELSAVKFVENPYLNGERLYKSGDLARYLANGEMEYLGRVDHQVKIRGFRIELGEIENQLLQYDLIRETIVIAKDDNNNTKYLCAYLVAGNNITVSEIREYLSQKLPDYMIPSYFIQLEKLPLTSNGKIDRKLLAEFDDQLNFLNTGVEFIAPSTDLEMKIASVWQEVLQRDRIGIDDNFFDLGGNSVLLIQVNSLIKQQLNMGPGTDLPLMTHFRYPTIRSFVRFINEDFKETEEVEMEMEELNQSKRVMHQTLSHKRGVESE